MALTTNLDGWGSDFIQQLDMNEDACTEVVGWRSCRTFRTARGRLEENWRKEKKGEAQEHVTLGTSWSGMHLVSQSPIARWLWTAPIWHGSYRTTPCGQGIILAFGIFKSPRDATFFRSPGPDRAQIRGVIDLRLGR